MRLFIYVLCFFTLSINNCFCQLKPTITTEIGSFLGTSSQLPFWQSANQFGAVPNTSPALVGKIGVHSVTKTDSLYKQPFLGIRYDFEAFGSLESKSQFNIIEANIELRFGKFILNGGRKKEIYGLADTLLSTGSMGYSANALPIPKIQLATQGYIEVPFTDYLFAFQGTYAHGWLGETKYAPNWPNPSVYKFDKLFLHQKTFYGRIGKPSWKYNFFGGFIHSVYWGNERNYSNIELSDAEIYRRVILGLNWSASSVGNSLGTVDVAMSINGKKWQKYFYRQFFYDTGSLLNGRNLDGLTGVRFSRKSMSNNKFNINQFLIEYLYTNDQLDPSLAKLANLPIAHNDYFNHYIYLDGWTYKGRLLGSPMATLDKNLKENAGNKDYKLPILAISNNRIYALHIAVKGVYAKNVNFMIKTTFSRNEGTYGIAFAPPRYQFSSLIAAERKFKNGIIGKASLATDLGGLYTNQAGLYIGIMKRW